MSFVRSDVTEHMVENFVRATGGGKGRYAENTDLLPLSKSVNSKGETFEFFHQTEKCKSPSGVKGLGFGRIEFSKAAAGDPKPFVRVPFQQGGVVSSSGAMETSISSDPRLILHFVETVWNLTRPKLLVSITGGAVDFQIPPDLEHVLSDLMRFARRTDAWLTTGGTYGGIMKYFGSRNYDSNNQLHFLVCKHYSLLCRASSLPVRHKYTVTRHSHVGSDSEQSGAFRGRGFGQLRVCYKAAC